MELVTSWRSDGRPGLSVGPKIGTPVADLEAKVAGALALAGFTAPTGSPQQPSWRRGRNGRGHWARRSQATPDGEFGEAYRDMRTLICKRNMHAAVVR